MYFILIYIENPDKTTGIVFSEFLFKGPLLGYSYFRIIFLIWIVFFIGKSKIFYLNKNTIKFIFDFQYVQ